MNSVIKFAEAKYYWHSINFLNYSSFQNFKNIECWKFSEKINTIKIIGVVKKIYDERITLQNRYSFLRSILTI